MTQTAVTKFDYISWHGTYEKSAQGTIAVFLAGTESGMMDEKFVARERTNLNGAMLEGAILDGADLRGVDLSGVMGLTSAQLDAAITDDSTRLPSEWGDLTAADSLG